MATNSPLRLHLAHEPVRLVPAFDAAGELTLHYRGMSLSASDDAFVIHFPDRDARSVTVEILDFKDVNGRLWTVTAKHHQAEWTRGVDRCSYAWCETSGEVRVDVTATSGGVSKTKPSFFKIPPEGDRPWHP